MVSPGVSEQPPANLLFHSDRGVQYASADYRRALAQAGLIASMSRKGNCYDNAAMESFWSTLKLELVYRPDFVSRRQARSEIFDYIRDGEDLVLEPFDRLIAERQLLAYPFDGFWRNMDTFKDKQDLDDLLSREPAPWQVWKR